MSLISKFRSCALTITLLSLILISPKGIGAQCGNADGDPLGAVDISDLSAIMAYLIYGTPIPNYGNADVDGYQDVTISDYFFMQDRFYCDFGVTYDRCGLVDSSLNPTTRSGDRVWIDNALYPPYSGGRTIYFNVYVKSVDSIRGFTLPF